MREAIIVYLSIGAFVWFLLTLPSSELVEGYQRGEYSSKTMVIISLAVILFWPRLAVTILTGK